ncbi:hypothetical protein NHQ30_003235 [Ciborinia camelliae]|nr:hypothetical protein NHQ30_003235 [Ciborinia camelliae]
MQLPRLPRLPPEKLNSVGKAVHALCPLEGSLGGLCLSITPLSKSLKQVTAAASVESLAQWLDSGVLSVPAEKILNAAVLPFAVVLQVTLYIQHIDNTDSGSDYSHTLQSLQQYGVQGFCTGLFTTAAIDFSENEEQLALNTSISLRLAMCIGAYIDQTAMYAEPLSTVCALSVRWKQVQGPEEKQPTEALKEACLCVKTVGINGRFHSTSDHNTAAQKLKAFTQSAKGLQYPNPSQLKAPLRMNTSREPISGDVSVTDITIGGILFRNEVLMRNVQTRAG